MMDRPVLYTIRVRGMVPECWLDRLSGMQARADSPLTTTLEGWLPDQSALAGVLDTLFELHLPVLGLSSGAAAQGSPGPSGEPGP